MLPIFIEYVYLIIVILALVMVANKINHHAEFDEELIRKYFSLIDFEELKIREQSI